MQNLVSLTNESLRIFKGPQILRRAAISPDYLDFNDHAYVTMQAIILRTLISMVSPKTGLASLTYYNNQRFTLSMRFWPYLAYVFTFKKGNTPAIRTAIECVNKASKCYDRYGS